MFPFYTPENTMKWVKPFIQWLMLRFYIKRNLVKLISTKLKSLYYNFWDVKSIETCKKTTQIVLVFTRGLGKTLFKQSN